MSAVGSNSTRAVTTRRSILGAGTLAALAGISTAALATTAPGSDAKLITLCARYDALEEQIRKSFDRELIAYRAIESRSGERAELHALEEQGNASREPLQDQQEELFEQIAATPATTLAGVRALAKTWKGWDQQLADGASDEAYRGQRFAWKLVEALISGALVDA